MLALSSSRPLPFVAAIGHPPLQKKSSPFPRAVYTLDIHVYQVSMSRERVECFCTTYKASVMLCVFGGGRLRTSTTLCTVRNLTDVRTMTVVRLRYGNKLLTATVHAVIKKQRKQL